MNAIDLFAGACGGWSLGLHRAGFRTVAACEIDPWRRSAYGRNFPDVRLYDDVRTLTADRLAADGIVRVDVVAASPPCQDISAANHKGRGVDGERSGLFFDAVRLVSELRPDWACFENSPRLRTRGGDRIIEALEALGYTCWPLVVGADDAGANHRRKRVWLVAHSAGVGRSGAGALVAPRVIEGDTAGSARRGPGLDGCGDAADAHRHTVRIESGRRGEANGAAAAVAAVSGRDVAHANGQGQHAGARDAAAVGRRARAGSAAGGHAADADAARLAVWQSVPGDDGAQRPAAERDRARPWAGWNGGPPGPDRMDARLSTELDYAACQAAFGDAVVPQITEAIGRAILAADALRHRRTAA